MKVVFTVLFTVAALIASAKDLTIAIDTTAPKRASFPCGVPCVGYVADPVPGDEAAVLAYRRAGAWLFRTSQCDDATIAFCAQYGLRIFLVLEGDQKACSVVLQRISSGPHKNVIAGIQLGSDPKVGTDMAKWRSIAALAARLFPGIAIALPVEDLDSPTFTGMRGYLAAVTHLVVDLRASVAPYKKLDGIATKLRNSSDKAAAKLRLWAIAPGKRGDMADEQASAPAAIVWQWHWIMAAFAVDRTDGVLIDRPCRTDDFGLVMRHFWAATFGNPSLVGHGEGETAGVVVKKNKAPVADLSLDDDDAGGLELNDAWTPGPTPVACANVAAGKHGDVEYLVLLAPPAMDDGREEQRVCLVMVNSSGEPVKLKLDVNRKGGDVSSGWRRRMVPDASKGGMRDSTRERGGKPFLETIEDNEFTVIDFRI